MPFGVVEWVGRGMGVLDGVKIVEREGAMSVVNVGHPMVSNEILRMRGVDAAHPRFLRDFSLTKLTDGARGAARQVSSTV